MSASTVAADRPLPENLHGGSTTSLGWAISDALTITKRNLTVLRRVPQLLVFSTIQPILFVLMFRYVFGSAIQIPGVRYVDFLMPGVFAQTVAFGAVNTAIGLSEDMGKGLVDRFRSLPMARSAVLLGRTLADAIRNLFVVTLMVVVGLMVGFRPASVGGLVAAAGLLLLFGYAMSWLFALIGLRVANAESAQAASFPLLFPLVFASGAFTPAEAIDVDWLRWFAQHQPVGAVVSAVRALSLGQPAGDEIRATLLWSVGMLVVLVPLAVRSYRKRT